MSDQVTSDSDREESRLSVHKRRKTTKAFVPVFKQDLSDDEDDEDEEDEDNDEGEQEQEDTPNDEPDSKGIKVLTKEELEAHNAAKARTGVVYISRIPPFMKPHKLKHLLSEYGETGRIFLAPENAKSYAKRVKYGGNKRRLFTEGWIEFLDKRKARLVAESLNARQIGGKKSNIYHDDIWNLKYLPKFKWDNLTAQIAAEKASRQARLTAELEQGKRESQNYLKNAEQAKTLRGIQSKRLAKDQPVTSVHKRDFEQRSSRDKSKSKSETTPSLSTGNNKLNSVMNSIFS